MEVAKYKMTEEEFLRLPDDGRKYELVDGEAKEVPTGFRHEEIGAVLIAALQLFVRRSRLGRVAGSSAGFRMRGGNIRSPDVSFVAEARLPEGQSPVGFMDGAPDLAVEIISPTEDFAELARKLGEYFVSGARMVWIVHPETRTVTVYRSLTDARTLAEDEELDGGDVVPGFKLAVKALFE